MVANKCTVISLQNLASLICLYLFWGVFAGMNGGKGLCG